jgi:hypothetical protein
MGLLGSDRRIMGEYASSRYWKTAYWACLAAVVGFGLIAVVAAF